MEMAEMFSRQSGSFLILLSSHSPPLLPSGLWLSTNLLYSSVPQLGSMPSSLLISPSCPRENSAEPARWPVPSALSFLITLSSRVTWWLSTALERPVSWPSCWSLQRSLLLFIMKIPNQVSTKWLITIRIKGRSVLNSIALPRKYMLDCLWIRGHTLCNLLLKGIAKKKNTYWVYVCAKGCRERKQMFQDVSGWSSVRGM